MKKVKSTVIEVMKLIFWPLIVAILETVDVFFVVLYYNKENVLEFCNNSELFV